MSKKHTPSFPRSCVGMQTETNPSQGMDSHAGAWEPDVTKKYLPKLRFPEFRDAREWEYKPLFKVCEINPTVDSLPNKFIYIDLESVVSGSLLFKKEITKNTAPSRAQRLLKNGDVIYQMVRPYQKNNLLCDFTDGNNYVASTGYAQLRSFDSSDFLYQVIHTGAFVNDVLANSTGSNYPAINSKDLAKIGITIPKPPEQQKIANCLSSIDDLITTQAQKTEALKAHKKGLMQQLFPREGETVPRLRFPEFRDVGEWEEKPLNKITTSIFDGTHQTPKYTDGGIPFFSVENIVSGKTNKFISKEDYLIATKKNKPEKEDILITRIGNIGFSTIVDWDHEFSIYVTLAVVKSDERFNSYYLHCFMQSERYQMEIQSKSLLNAVPCKINMDELRKTTVLLPCLREQQNIANCLSSIDDLITAQAKKIDSLKAHKKGLMQQLFPPSDKLGA